MRRKYRGFTLIEILIVVAIIGILATIVMLSLGGAQARSKYARVIADMTSIAKAVDLYQTQHNNIYPDNVDAGAAPTFVGGVSMGTDFSDYLPTWPKPPCSDDKYKYDYNNIDDNGVSNGGKIGIEFGYFDAGINKGYYYNNIHGYPPTSPPAGTLGVSIQSVNQVTCKEYTPA